MKGFLQHRFFQIYLAIVILGGAGLGYFLYQSKSDLDASNGEYAEAVQRLQTLQAHKPFPNENNLKKLQQQQSNYKEQFKILADSLRKREIPLKEMTPQVFQEHLRQMVADFHKKAADQHVSLPANFYLSFDRYKDSLPSAQATPFLERQLESIALVLNKLLDLKIRGILSVSRRELPEELSPPAAANKSIVTLSPFNILFVAEQNKAREAFNFILNTDPFFIIRQVAISNSQQEGPSRKEDNEPASIPMATTAGNAPVSATLPSAGALPPPGFNIPPGAPLPQGAPLPPGVAPQRANSNPHASKTATAAATPASSPTATLQSPSPSGETSAPQRIKVIVGRETIAVGLGIDQVNFQLSEITK